MLYLVVTGPHSLVCMFVDASAPVALPVVKAREVLATALDGSAVPLASNARRGEEMVSVHDVGPRGVSTKVLVHTLPPRRKGEVTIVPIRWESTSIGSHLLPRLDANLVLVPVDDVTCVLSIIGCYEAPLGRFGDAIDRAALVGVARRTLQLFVRELAKRMELDAHALHAGV